MGCSNVSGGRRPQNIKVDFKQELTEIEKVDNLFKGAFEILAKVEKIRKKLSVRWNRVLKSTGAIVCKDPSIKHVFMGALWKISNDMADVKKVSDLVKISLSSPFVKFDGPENLITPDVKDIGECLKNFFMVAYEMKDDIPGIISSVQKYFEELSESIKNVDQMFEGLGFMEIAKGLSKLKNNISKIANGKQVIQAIGNIILGTFKDLPELLKMFQDVERVKEIYTVGETSRKNKWETARRIVWETDKGEKACKSFEDYLKLVEEDEENEKAAKAEGEDEAPEPDEKEGMVEDRPDDPAEKGGDDGGDCGNEEEAEKNPAQKKTQGNSNNSNAQATELQNKLIRSEAEMKKLEERVKAAEQEKRELNERLNKLLAGTSNGGSNTINVNANPLPVIIYKQSPLKSAQLVLKKSISTKNDVPATVSENLPDLNQLAFGLENGTVFIIDSESLEDIVYFQSSHKGSVTSICYLSDGDTILSGGVDGKVFKHSISSKSSTLFIEEKAAIGRIIYGLDGDTVYISSGKKVTTFSLNSKVAKLTQEKKSDVTALHYLRSHQMLFIGSGNSLSFFNVKTGETVSELSHKNSIYDVTDITAYSHKGNISVAYVETESKSGNATLVVFDHSKQEESKRKELNIKNVKNLIYSHDHKTLIAASSEKDNGVFVIYNTKSDTKKSLSTRGNAYNSLQYLGGEYVLALTTDDGSIDFWTYAK